MSINASYVPPFTPMSDTLKFALAEDELYNMRSNAANLKADNNRLLAENNRLQTENLQLRVQLKNSGVVPPALVHAALNK